MRRRRRPRLQALTVCALGAGALGLVGMLLSEYPVDVAMFFALFATGAGLGVADAAVRRLRRRVERIEAELERQRERAG